MSGKNSPRLRGPGQELVRHHAAQDLTRRRASLTLPEGRGPDDERRRLQIEERAGQPLAVLRLSALRRFASRHSSKRRSWCRLQRSGECG